MAIGNKEMRTPLLEDTNGMNSDLQGPRNDETLKEEEEPIS